MRTLLILLALLLGWFNLQGQGAYADDTRFPEGMTGEKVRALIQALNSNDPAQIEAFIQKHTVQEFQDFAPMADHVAVFQNFFRETGGIDFYSMRTYTPPRPYQVVIVRDRVFNAWRGLSFRIPENGTGLHELQFTPARPPAGWQAETRKLTREELVEELGKKLDKLCQEDRFSGTLLVAKGEEIWFQRACGEATKSWHIANNLDTRFNLGSMNKMFTSLAIMQLVEKGKIQLNDPLSLYVDETWLPQSLTNKVTIRHLLTHSSGLGSYFNDKYFQSSRDLFRQLDDYKPLIHGDTLAFEPGSQFSYSNTGMFLLGVVIEKASGENYFDYIRNHIYAPAGMIHSDCYELDRPVENLAEGYYLQGPGQWKNNLFLHVLKGGPAGGGYSTAPDLHRFALALMAGKLVSPESLAQMWTDPYGAEYGFGFGVEETPAGLVVGHGGGFPGLNSQLTLFPKQGFIIVVMSNYDNGANGLQDYIRGLVSRE